MTLRLNGSTSGYVEIDAPAVAGSTSITLPATSGGEFVVSDSNGRVGIGTTSPGSFVAGGSQLVVGSGSGSQGITIYAGSSNASALYFADGTTGTESYRGTVGYEHSTDSVFFSTAASERARIDSSGRLLVGTFSESGNALLNVRGNTGSATGVGVLNIGLGTTRPTATNVGIGYIRFTSTSNSSSNYHYASINCETDGASSSDTDIPGRLVFSTTADGASSPTERLRIEKDGSTVFRNLTAVYPNSDNAAILGGGSNRWSAVYAANGTIQTSDQRAKTEIADAQLGSDFVKSLRPVSYKWIEGGKVDSGKRDEDGNYIYESVPGTRTHWGFLAQEVKQAVDAAGVDFGGWVLTDKDDPDSQQALRYDQFIAPLTKALQEALAKIETLETRLTALEGGTNP